MEMAGIGPNGQKCLIFIVVPLLRIENIKKRRREKNRNIYLKYEKYM